MNPESLKTELQQVLDNDLALRKEFNELRRSLSDYRNQLIMRDEDCIRLQVTIDVLNTKLSVFERDNSAFRSEIEALRDVQGVLNGELSARQQELETRAAEIAVLRQELTDLNSEYERKTEELREEAGQQLMRLREQYNQEVSALQHQTSQDQDATKEQYEQRIAALSDEWTRREQELGGIRDNELSALRERHAEELSMLREQYNATIASLSATSHEQQAELKLRYETMILELEQRLQESQGEIGSRHQEELSSTRSLMEEERAALVQQFDLNLEAIAAEYAEREERARQGYEARIADLRAELAATTEELTLNLEQHVAAVKTIHEEELRQNSHAFETKIAELTNLYEDRIANLLIHSNASNSKLTAELDQLRSEAEEFTRLVADLNNQVESRDQSINLLSGRLEETEMQLSNEQERSNALSEQLLNQAQENNSDELALLKEEMARQNHIHSDYVAELNLTIATLSDEVQNMASVFVTVTNDLGSAECTIDSHATELDAAKARISELEAELAGAAVTADVRSAEELEQRLAERELAYNKLLAENEGLITEIEAVQRQSEVRAEELELIKSELNEQKHSFEARVGELKETLELKNNEISNVQDRNLLLERELQMARQELADLSGVLSCSVGHQPDDSVVADLRSQVDSLNDQLLALLTEKEQMALQLLKMNEVIGHMSEHVESENIDVTGLNNHRKNAILAGNSQGAGEPAAMKKQINELVREIDKCIALLSA